MITHDIICLLLMKVVHNEIHNVVITHFRVCLVP